MHATYPIGSLIPILISCTYFSEIMSQADNGEPSKKRVRASVACQACSESMDMLEYVGETSKLTDEGRENSRAMGIGHVRDAS